MSEIKSLKCKVCAKAMDEKAAWLPEVTAMRRANDDKEVTVSDFPRFTMCGYHGHLLRDQGVRVYRYTATLERETKRATRREADTAERGCKPPHQIPRVGCTCRGNWKSRDLPGTGSAR